MIEWGDANPVAINVTGLVAVLLCLCLFFMCAGHFTPREGAIEVWLPVDRHVTGPVVEEIRAIVFSADRTAVHGAVLNRTFSTSEECARQIEAALTERRRLGLPTPPVIIDANTGIPWRCVVQIIDHCRRRGVARIELARPFVP